MVPGTRRLPGEQHEQKGIARHVVRQATVRFDSGCAGGRRYTPTQRRALRTRGRGSASRSSRLDACRLNCEKPEVTNAMWATESRRSASHVALHEGDEASVNTAMPLRMNTADEDERAFREHRQREAYEAVTAHLQQHAGRSQSPRSAPCTCAPEAGMHRPWASSPRSSRRRPAKHFCTSTGSRAPSARIDEVPASITCRSWRSASAANRARV